MSLRHEHASIRSDVCGTNEAKRRLAQPEQTKHGQTCKFKFKQCGLFARRAKTVTAVQGVHNSTLFKVAGKGSISILPTVYVHNLKKFKDYFVLG